MKRFSTILVLSLLVSSPVFGQVRTEMRQHEIKDFRKHLKILRNDFNGVMTMTSDSLLEDTVARYLVIYRKNGTLLLEGLKNEDGYFKDTIKYYDKKVRMSKIEYYYVSSDGCLEVDNKTLFCDDGNIRFGIWKNYNTSGVCIKEIEYEYVPTEQSEKHDSFNYDYIKIKRTYDKDGNLKREKIIEKAHNKT